MAVDARHHHLRGAQHVGAEQFGHALPVDGEVQRLADADVVERRLLRIDPDRRGFRVQVGEVGFRIGRVLDRDGGGQLGLAGLDHRRAQGGFAAPDIGCLGDIRRLAPIAVEPVEHDGLRRERVELVGAGADGIVDRLVGGSGGRDHHGDAQQRRQDRFRLLGLDIDGQLIDRRHRQLGAAELREVVAGEGAAGHPLEGEGDGLRVEFLAVLELDAVAQVETPCRVVDPLPFRRQLGLRRAVLRG